MMRRLGRYVFFLPTFEIPGTIIELTTNAWVLYCSFFGVEKWTWWGMCLRNVSCDNLR